MTSARWIAEMRKMNEAFPSFQPFERNGRIGFTGELYGPAGKVYAVKIVAWKRGYPAVPPQIFIDPQIGSNWGGDGSLCVQRPWRPEKDTFAQQVLYAIAYLDDQRRLSEMELKL